MDLRYQSLLSILERNGFLRKTMAGIQNDYPFIFSSIALNPLIKSNLEESEIFINSKNTDNNFFIYIKKDFVLFIPKQSMYSKFQYESIAKTSDIPISEFEEVINATSD